MESTMLDLRVNRVGAFRCLMVALALLLSDRLRAQSHLVGLKDFTVAHERHRPRRLNDDDAVCGLRLLRLCTRYTGNQARQHSEGDRRVAHALQYGVVG